MLDKLLQVATVIPESYESKSNYGKGGVTSLYKGLQPTLLAVAPFIGLYKHLMIYISRCLLILAISNHPLALFRCGAVVGLTAQRSHPLDVERRIQLNKIPDKKLYKSQVRNLAAVFLYTWLRFSQSLAEGGARSPCGIFPTMLKGPSCCSVSCG